MPVNYHELVNKTYRLGELGGILAFFKSTPGTRVGPVSCDQTLAKVKINEWREKERKKVRKSLLTMASYAC